MTTNYHTPIPSSPNQAAAAALFNSRLSDLDTHLTDAITVGQWNGAEIAAARGAYTDLDARLDAFVLAGGNVATKANGVSNAGQQVVTVDSTSGFVVGANVTYYLDGTTLEGNTIASIQPGVSLTLGTNIGTGGVLDDTYISMISISEYLAAQAIPHAGTLMLPDTIETISANVHYVNAYGAVGDGATDDTTAIQAALTAVNVAGGGTVEFAAGKTYSIATKSGGIQVYSNTRVVGNGAILYAGDIAATQADGAASAGQKVVTVDSTTGFTAGETVLYPLVSGALEQNTIDTVDSGTQLTLITNIGATGIANNAHIQNSKNEYCQLYIASPATNIEITGLKFTGDNDPYLDTLIQNQCCGIFMDATVSGTIADISIHHCSFYNLYGFSVHGIGVASRYNISDNIMVECGNGLNVSANDSLQCCNRMHKAESIEVSSSNTVIADNVLTSCYAGIAIGGNTTPGDLVNGMIVRNNIIEDTTDSVGISVTDGVDDALVTGNIITRTYKNGISVIGTGYNDVRHVTIINNILRSCGHTDDVSNRSGIYAGANLSNVKITNNTIYNHADDAGGGNVTRLGIQLYQVDRVDIDGNVLTDIDALDIYGNEATNITLGRNVATASKLTFEATCTFAEDGNAVRTIAGTWYQDDVSASQTAVALELEGGNRTEIIMPMAGAITGIAVYSNAARSAGTLTVDVTINGTATGLQAVLDGSATTADQTTQSIVADKVAAGDRIGVKITTDGSWAPTTADITVSVLVVIR